MKAKFIRSAAYYSQLPTLQNDEFCLMGRSNVGKSSFINHVFKDRRLARVSKKPGTTTCANYYEINDGTAWVDLPGYGFARAPKNERVRFSSLIEEYCVKRKNLKGCIWLIDARHVGLSIDQAAHRWLLERRLPLFPILVKSDEVSNADIEERMRLFMDNFNVTAAPLTYSIRRIDCREEFWNRFMAWRNAIR